MTGVDLAEPFDDFAVTTDGKAVTGAEVTGVSGNGDTYTVTVSTGTGSGTIQLEVWDDDSIQDAAGNPLGGPGQGNGDFTAGETYTVHDETGMPVSGWLSALAVCIAAAIALQPRRPKMRG